MAAMKLNHCGVFAVAAAVLLFGRPATAAQLQKVQLAETPVSSVVTLLEELKAKIESEGSAEQSDYDKYACWVADTLARKSEAISSAKESIENLEAENVKLSGEIATHTAEVSQLKQDVDANIASSKEAIATRQQENEEFEVQKTESEQCTGALEGAIKALSGAGTGKKFLQTIQYSQVLSAAAGIRDVLHRPFVLQHFSDSDIQAVKLFAERPGDYLGASRGSSKSSASALQVDPKIAAANPFGDYAPRSTQIQGILQNMYDTFAKGMEKDNAEESDAQKAHEELMATKMRELATLKATLQQQEVALATKTKQKADNVAELEDTRVQLAADEKVFADTKDAGQEKASQWSERTRLRTQELEGIAQAVVILGGQKSVEIFEAAHGNAPLNVTPAEEGTNATLLQVAANVARRAGSRGHFDKIIADIEKMIATVRKEEQDDIAHRDRCQRAEGKNTNDMEDYTSEISKAEGEILRLDGEQNSTSGEITNIAQEISSTQGEMAALLEMRTLEQAHFEEALEFDTKAVALIEQAITALSSFYRSNGIPLSLVRKNETEYTVDPDKAPEMSWKDGNYKGSGSETGGIVAILSMLKEDLEKEILTAREGDATAQKEYLGERAAFQSSVDALNKLQTVKEQELAALQDQEADTSAHKDKNTAKLGTEEDLKTELYSDCSWVATHFDTRREKRKVELQGLQDAKNYLGGGGDEAESM